MNDAPAGESNSYDEVTYDSYPFVQAHPDRHAAIATLFGMSPPRLAHARILELGCASGGHLLPLAEAFPTARFLGIDLSSRQIEEGRETVRAIGLPNVELRHASILDVTPEWGVFDYIICHGVFSWVPAEVQRKIFTICRDQLAPEGVAYVSYNVYPGWRLRGMLRDMMCYHAGRFAEPGKRVEQAQALLDFLAHAAMDKDGPYGLLLKREVEILSRKPASYLLHEFLEEVNEPLYFHQFIEQAEAHELQYLGEARLPSMAPWNHPRAVQETLARVAANIIEQEQYLDFVRNRAFRETLLCHQGVKVNRSVSADRLAKLRVAGPLIAAAPIDLGNDEPLEFTLSPGNTITTRNRLAKAAYALLGQSWPASFEFGELVRRAAALVLGGHEPDAAELARGTTDLSARLIKLAARSELLRFSTEPAPCVANVSAKPAVSALARREASQRGWCTNRLHEATELTSEECALIALLDSTRDLEELRRAAGPKADGLLRGLARRALLVS